MAAAAEFEAVSSPGAGEVKNPKSNSGNQCRAECDNARIGGKKSSG